MSEEFKIENFEDLMNVFENTGDFGEYYLGDYSNIQIANYLRKMQQENKQLKDKYENVLIANRKLIKEIDDYQNIIIKIKEQDRQLKEKIKKVIKCIKNQYYEKEYRTKGTFVNKLMVILGDKE